MIKGVSMENTEIKEQVYQFCASWQGLNMIYADYARTVNIPYTSLQILSFILMIENCTQKIICEQAFLPKQTVNSVITAFYKEGLVQLQELPYDRRTKAIHLTESGKRFAESLLPRIREAEYKAMEALTSEQREALLEGMRIYCDAFRKSMLEE
jgi:DNA-binding MarR family transcriptional regulator